ncbi:MAG: serine hydrolase domain-containing protein [Isosphaeraceae bacterium]
MADERISRVLAPVRDQHNLVGLVGAIVRSEGLVGVGVQGKRKVGSDVPVEPSDRVHLGSCTKAMTATMIGSLVEEKKLGWDSTLADVFPSRAGDFHPDFRKVTLWQLLTHRAGLPHDGPWWNLGRGRSTTDQRRELLSRMLGVAPLSPPGQRYEYSNVGYAIAGLMAEETTGRSWEDLMRDRLFKPLGMTSTGFGIPGIGTRVDQPWGHHDEGGTIRPIRADNAAAMGPAGTIHASMADWARFSALHLRAARGKPSVLAASTFRKLHTPPSGHEYAGGWFVAERSWAGGKTLMHKGSNTMWYASVWIAPLRDLAVLVATNQAGGNVDAACDAATEALLRLDAFRQRTTTPSRRSRG